MSPLDRSPVRDVLVVGAGPAGSAAASLLARHGWDVLIVDRASFPRPKACGECLNPGAVAALRRLALLSPVLALAPARLEGWTLATEDGAAARGSFRPVAERGLAVARETLDEALLRSARGDGATFEGGVRVTGVVPPERRAPARVSVRERDGSVGIRRARIVLGADGLRSAVASALGAVRRPPRLRKLSLTCRILGAGPRADRGALYFGGPGTVGLAPVSASRPLWNVTVVADPRIHGRDVAGRPGAFLLDALAGAPFAWERGPEIVGGPWASGPFDRPCRPVPAPGVLLLGDAAGYYDPLTGQGIYRALHSAELAAPVVDRALRRREASEGALASYARALRRAVASGRAVQRTVEAAVARVHVRDSLVALLGAFPGLADDLVRVTGDAAPVTRLMDPARLGALAARVAWRRRWRTHRMGRARASAGPGECGESPC